MSRVVDQAIVLRRTNYGEADRVVSFITNNNGKVSVLARGVRKPKSKLAAGIEPFCVNEICFMPGRGELSTITSAKIVKHHTNFLTDISRLELAQQILKTIDKKVADNSSSDFFDFLKTALEQVNSSQNIDLVEVWCLVKFADLSGIGLNLAEQVDTQAYEENAKYLFDIESGGFFIHPEGVYDPAHIKYLRLARVNLPSKLARIEGVDNLTADLLPVLRSFSKIHLS